MLHAVWSDARLAVRTLVRAPGFAMVAIGTLGTGLALSVTVIALVNAYLLRALPYPASDRLFNVRYAAPGRDMPQGMAKLDWRALRGVVEHAIAWDLDLFSLRGAPHPEAVPGAWVTPGFIEGFGVKAALGRGFAADDFEPGRPQVALISHRLWQTRFGGDRSIVGRRVEAYVSDRPDEAEGFTVVGVLPERFWHTNPYTDVIAPLRAPSFPYMVRVRPGIAAEAAADRISTLVRSGGMTLPPDWRAELLPAQSEYVRQVRPVLLSVAAATGLVLLIACANVAVLLLVRSTARRREVAVRKALGATAARIARLLMVEALVLGASATAFGLVLGRVIVSSLGPVIERQLGRRVPGGTAAMAVDGTTMAFAVVCGLLTTCAFMLAPLLSSWRTPVALALTMGSRSATDGPAQQRARSMLIALEVAACLTLLVGAALMVESGLRMLRVDIGMRAGDVLVAGVGMRERSYPSAASRVTFFERLMARSAAIPGGRGVALSDWWPLQAPNPRQVGRDAPGAPTTTRAGIVGVSPSYFDTLEIGLRDGRAFSDRDRLGGERIAIVSETLAARLWPGQRAVGERLRVEAPPDANAADTSPGSYLVVGVARDVRQGHADDDLADIYAPLLQRPGRFAFAYARVAGAPSVLERELRAAVAAVDPDVPLGTPRLLADILDQERARPRFLAALLVAFAVFAALLALVGIYGVIAYAVRQREREIAVRMAIGADGASITRLFLRHGIPVLGVGLALGVGGAVGIGRLLETQLFGVRAADPRVIGAAALAFGLCGLMAIWWPAMTAASTDPARALKQD